MELDNQNLNQIFKATLSDDEFNKLSTFIYTNYGIKMPPVKRIMLQSRLQKRLRVLGMTNFKDYCQFVFSKEGQNEIIHMIDVVSTNKTDFFREPVHFDFLRESVLPAFVEKHPNGKTIKVWSAGCSSGEEPYTLAITLHSFFEKQGHYDFSIYGTDISTRILQSANEAIYKEEKIAVIPLDTKRKYFLKSKDREKKLVRVVADLRKKVTFTRLNFMDTVYNVPEDFDIIFCRNVLIYFDRDTQEKVINRLCNRLKSGGYLFLGHSESITNIKVPLQQIKPTIFMRL